MIVVVGGCGHSAANHHVRHVAAVGAVVVGVSIWLAADAVAADEFARGLSAYNAVDYRTAFDA